MSKATQNSEQSKGQLTADDLGLVDDRLEDESKSDEDIFDEIGAAEAAAENGEDDADNKLAAESHAAADKDDDPDKKAGEEPSGHDDKDTQQAGEENEADKLWAGANDEQRAAFDAAQERITKLEQYKRSNYGRVSTLQRQINDITKQFDRVASTATPDKPGDSEGAAAQSVAAQGAATNDFLDSKDWKEFNGEYPEVAGPLGKLVSGMKTEITGLTKQLDAIGNDRRQDAVNEQTEILEKDHPDWQDAATDDAFGPWLESQPRHMREAALRNAEQIVDASEAADVIGRFKAFRSEQSNDSAGPGNDGKGDEPKPGDQEPVTSLTGKRKRQLESSSGARPRGAGAAHGIPEDGDDQALWDAWDKQEAREARQA